MCHERIKGPLWKSESGRICVLLSWIIQLTAGQSPADSGSPAIELFWSRCCVLNHSTAKLSVL